MKSEEAAQNNSYWIIKVYPFAVLVLAIALNFMFGIDPIQISNPSRELLGLISFSAIILVINHSWIMTVTELTRNRYKIFASPEEWTSSGYKKLDVTEKGSFEIDRCLNTHRNTTENIVYYILFLFVFSFVSPSQIAAWVWVLVFPISRLGYTYSYFTGSDNARGIFMSLSLLSVYGIASYLAFGFMFK
ncbi:MAPEG family protein [Kangiella sp.]|uniref:MAPEG family protein n=1 Tax=Kangiella sp. TaxID=1920245 RepID=UPI003A949A60